MFSRTKAVSAPNVGAQRAIIVFGVCVYVSIAVAGSQIDVAETVGRQAKSRLPYRRQEIIAATAIRRNCQTVDQLAVGQRRQRIQVPSQQPAACLVRRKIITPAAETAIDI